MKTILIELLSGADIAHAAISPIATFVGKVNRLIINPIIILLFAGAMTYFLYGVVQFLASGGSEEARKKGQKTVMYGLLGMFIMFAVKGILALIQSTLGVTGVNPNLP